MSFNYFIPLIHLGPVAGYTFIQEIPLHDINVIIKGENAKFEIIRKVIADGNILLEKKIYLTFFKNKWVNNNSALFRWIAPKDFIKPCYIETQMNLLEGKGLLSCSLPPFYVSYISNASKNYISCGNEKYGNPRVIMQMREFGKWVDGYPAINIEQNRNTTYSLIIINPYKVKNSITVEINSLKIKKQFSVEPFSVRNINFYDIIKKKSWTGQFYVYGKRRIITYLANHAFDDFNKISTIEHGDPFRAEFTHQPRFQYLRNQIHKKIKRVLG